MVTPRTLVKMRILFAATFFGCLDFDSRAQVATAERQPSSVTSSIPTLVMQQVDTIGQIYIASDRPGEEQEPAQHVLVRIAVPENNDTVYQTRSDKNGGYLIPRLKPGAYRMYIGGLRMGLLVETASPSNAQLPKVLITVLPRDLARR